VFSPYSQIKSKRIKRCKFVLEDPIVRETVIFMATVKSEITYEYSHCGGDSLLRPCRIRDGCLHFFGGGDASRATYRVNETLILPCRCCVESKKDRIQRA
jgi:hypothetical protein